MTPQEARAQMQADSHWQDSARRFRERLRGVAATFACAVRVEAFRFHGPRREQVLGTVHGIDFYEKGVVQGRDFAWRLMLVVLRTENYESLDAFTTLCDFEPTIGFRVWCGGAFADVILCFKCGQVLIFQGDSDPDYFERPGSFWRRVRHARGKGDLEEGWLRSEAFPAREAAGGPT